LIDLRYLIPLASVSKTLAKFSLLTKFWCAIRRILYTRVYQHIVAEPLIFENQGLLFDASAPVAANRAESAFTKEPDLISFIRDWYRPEDIFFDIGANVGVFSIFAGSRGVHVYAFEPESSNFQVLNRNIQLNNLDELVRGYCVAVNDLNKASSLWLKAARVAGKSGNTFGVAVNEDGLQFQAKFQQRCIGLSLDFLCLDLKLPFPDHLKIDTDGNELAILMGATQVLKTHPPATICLEVNLKQLTRVKPSDLYDVLKAYNYVDVTERYPNPEYRKQGMTNSYWIQSPLID